MALVFAILGDMIHSGTTEVYPQCAQHRWKHRLSSHGSAMTRLRDSIPYSTDHCAKITARNTKAKAKLIPLTPSTQLACQTFIVQYRLSVTWTIADLIEPRPYLKLLLMDVSCTKRVRENLEG